MMGNYGKEKLGWGGEVKSKKIVERRASGRDPRYRQPELVSGYSPLPSETW